MNRFNKLIAISVLAASSTAVLAQGYNGPSTTTVASASHYAGPSTVARMTAKQLLANGVDNQYATLTGKLVRHTGGKHYILADSSGEISVEISRRYFPANQIIDANTTVQLTGKFDREHFGISELEVKQVTVVSK